MANGLENLQAMLGQAQEDQRGPFSAANIIGMLSQLGGSAANIASAASGLAPNVADPSVRAGQNIMETEALFQQKQDKAIKEVEKKIKEAEQVKKRYAAVSKDPAMASLVEVIDPDDYKQQDRINKAYADYKVQQSLATEKQRVLAEESRQRLQTGGAAVLQLLRDDPNTFKKVQDAIDDQDWKEARRLLEGAYGTAHPAAKSGERKLGASKLESQLKKPGVWEKVIEFIHSAFQANKK